MSISEAIREWFLAPVLNELKRMEATMANDQVALDAAIKALGDTLANEDTGIAALLAAVATLMAKVGTTPTADFTTEITAINSMAADIGTQTASIQDAVAKAAS